MRIHPLALIAILLVCAHQFGCGKPIADPERKLLNDAIEGSVGGVRLALVAGADVNARLNEDTTVLMWACARAHANGDRAVAIIDSLLDAGANLNARSADGSTALGWAANSSNFAVVRRLLEAGADVNVQNESGWTPLMAAARYGDPAVVQRLLEAGADPAAVDSQGRSALDVARAQSNTAARVLEEYGLQLAN